MQKYRRILLLLQLFEDGRAMRLQQLFVLFLVDFLDENLHLRRQVLRLRQEFDDARLAVV